MQNSGDKIRVGVLGATGYTALELIKILLRHQNASIVALTTRGTERPKLDSVHPSLAGRLPLHLEDWSPTETASRADCVFCCLPHGASAAAAQQILAAGKRVIDLSADYRLDDAETFRKWYGEAHGDPARLGKVVYGLPELFRKQIPAANLVANPGCYPTSAILPLTPFIQAGRVEAEDIIVDSKSGISGAGRTPKLSTLYPECNESIAAYGVGKHRHTPEIEQIVRRATGVSVQVVFTPHLTPMDRGILTTTYSRLKGAMDDGEAVELLRAFYRDEPFVRIVDHLPASKDTSHTNFCDITARVVGRRLVTISALDNLIKGASGAAVQNFNLMYGFDERAGLL